MAGPDGQLPWTDEQWTRVRQVVCEEARSARVAGSFLPLYGPLDANAAFVPLEKLVDPPAPPAAPAGYTVDDTSTLKLSTLQTKVFLRSAQVADSQLASALLAFRRSANVLARLEDAIVFNGQTGPDVGPPGYAAPQPWEVVGGQQTDGLVKSATAIAALAAPPANPGELLVVSVSAAVGELERSFHLGPFACVLSQGLYDVAQTPNGSLVLPQDRIVPFLGGGPLLRSSVLVDPAGKKRGLVVALGGSPIDLVMATDISVEFMQVTPDAWFVFRVYEKTVLRIKQATAIRSIAI